MSFGYSVGDFITGYNITYQLIRILSDSRGSCMLYQEAMMELTSMEQAFLQAGHVISSKSLSRDIKNGIACIVLSSKGIIEDFYERSKEYQWQLGQSRGGIERSWRAVGWPLFRKDELKTLKSQLHERLTSINALMTFASYDTQMPTSVAQYEDRSNDNCVETQPAPRGSLPPILQWQENQPMSRETTVVDPSEQGSMYTVSRSPGPDKSVDNTSSPMLQAPDRSRRGSQDQPNSVAVPDSCTPSHQQNNFSPTSLSETVVTECQNIEDARAAARATTLKATHQAGYSVTGEAAAVARLRTAVANASGLEDVPDWLPKSPEEQRRLVEEIKLNAEKEVRVRINEEAAAAAVATKREARLNSILEALEKMTAALNAEKATKEAAAMEAKREKPPIRFKDAVGRNFKFPFHLCKTWAGMEELIKQAFFHVDVIGPHVQAGFYDLLGPEGEIILPPVWEKVIQPDWDITMHMWPMERPEVPIQTGRGPRGTADQRFHGPLPPGMSKERPDGRGSPRMNGLRHLEPPSPKRFDKVPTVLPAPRNFSPGSNSHPPAKATGQNICTDRTRPSSSAYEQRNKLPPSASSQQVQGYCGPPVSSVELVTPTSDVGSPTPGQFEVPNSRLRRLLSSSRKSSKPDPTFEKLDAYDPTWRVRYGTLIAERGLTEAIIKENQGSIVEFLQNQRKGSFDALPRVNDDCVSNSESGDSVKCPRNRTASRGKSRGKDAKGYRRRVVMKKRRHLCKSAG